MSDKKLLEEQVVRRFMKLANIEQLSENFVQENMPEPEGQAPMEEVDELVDEPSMDGGNGEGNEELFKKIAQAVADAMGVDATVEGGDEEGMDMEDEEGMDMSDDEESDDMDMGDDEEGEEDEEEDDGEGEEELDEGEEELDEGEEEDMQEQIAEAVLTRVKARLLAEAKAVKSAEADKSKMKKKAEAKKAGKKMEEASKGHSTGKAGSVNWGLKGSKGVGNVAKSKAKKGNLTPAKKSSKHTK